MCETRSGIDSQMEQDSGRWDRKMGELDAGNNTPFSGRLRIAMVRLEMPLPSTSAVPS